MSAYNEIMIAVMNAETLAQLAMIKVLIQQHRDHFDDAQLLYAFETMQERAEDLKRK